MNKVRLIDANALKEAIHSNENRRLPLSTLIDNAPTVFDCRSCKNNGNERECVDCHDYSNYVHYEERPQGEWNYIQADMCVCPFCGAMPHKLYKNYCAKCGAELKGGAE